MNTQEGLVIEEKVWLVWRPEHGLPRVLHPSRESATNEAERLARANRGSRFYVLEVVALRVCDDMQRTDFDSEDIPF